MRATEIMKNLGSRCTRHLLRHWEGYIRPKDSEGTIKRRSVAKKKPPEQNDDYKPNEVAFIYRMFQAWISGLGPKEAASKARQRWLTPSISESVLGNMAQLAPELMSRESAELLYAVLQETPLPPSNAVQRGKALDRVARLGNQLLDAEGFSIFLTNRQTAEDLVLVADSKGAEDPIQLGFRIANYRNACGWTAKVASSRAPMNLIGPELERESRPTHLRYQRSSLLASPMIDRKGHLIGVMKAENKRAPSEMTFGVFDEFDEKLMAALAATTIPLLELQRVLVRGMGLINRLNEAASYQEIGDAVLNLVLRVTSADRAEISRWDEEHGLVFEVVAGQNLIKAGDTLKAGLDADQPSVTEWVYGNRKVRCIRDTSTAVDYFRCNPSTQSEIAVPIIFGAECVGVLNVESDRKGGDGGLDEQDVPIISVLATLVAISAQMAALRDSVIEKMPTAELELMRSRAIQQTRGRLDTGILYTANYRRGLLRVELFGQNRTIDSLPFSENALAAQIFRSKQPLFSRFPEKDPRVWGEALKAFDTRGSLVGIPIQFNTGLGSTVAGVVMMWDTSGARLTEEEAEEIMRRCQKVLVLEPRLRP